MDKIKRIKELIAILNRASYAYYNYGHSTISDHEFDILYEELKKLETETGVIFDGTPTHNVGTVVSEINKITHEHPMLSLDKCHTCNDVKHFAKDRYCIASVKLDGLTVSATYENGRLTRLETRGDGIEGGNVLFHKNSISNLPQKIKHNGKYVVDGECIVPTDIFEKMNSLLPENKKYANPRNTASGALNLLDSKISATRGLHFVVWRVIEDSENSGNSFAKKLIAAKNLGFEIVPMIYLSSDIEGDLQKIKTLAETNHLPYDGCVITFDDIEYGESLGKTSHHMNHSIAYKYDDEVEETILRDIEWSLGKTQITPVAIFDSVELEGSQVNRASLHNISICKSLQLGIGDAITVKKCNMIIPQLVDNLTRSNSFVIPDLCPVCGGVTKIVKDNDTEVLICTNENCKGKLLSRLSHFCSKNAMNIEGLSEATLEKIMSVIDIKNFYDLYTLRDHRDKLVCLEGLGTKSVDKIIAEIEKSKSVKLENFIYALSIPMIGRSQSKELSGQFKGDWGRFEDAIKDGYEFTIINGFGEVLNRNIHTWFKTKFLEEKINMLTAMMIFEKPKVLTTGHLKDLSGQTFVITGSLKFFSNRDACKAEIESHNGKVSGSISTKTNYLVNNDRESNTGKNKKALELNIPIISEEQLIQMIR